MPPITRTPFGTTEIATSTAGVVLGLMVVGLRLWARAIKKKRLAIGDYLIILAWVRRRSEIS